MKNVIIFYQGINREINACKKLKENLEKGKKVNTFIFSIDFESDLALKIAKKNKVDLIIMPWMYKDSNYWLMQPFIELNKELLIVNLHHEQIATPASLNLLLPDGEHSKNSVIHFVWGDNFKQELIKCGVKENLVYITGNVRTDFANEIKYNKKKLANEFKLDVNKKWILFAENRGWLLNSNDAKEEHLVYLGFLKEDLLERKRIEKKSLEKTVDEMNNLNNDFFNEYELIYRAHPGTEAPEGLSEKINIISKYSIYEWLNVIDINIVWSSTTIFESDICQIPSFVYEPSENLDKFRTFGIEQYQKITKLSDISEELINNYKEKIAPLKIYENYVGKVDGNSINRVSKSIIEILENKIEGYSAESIEVDKLFMLKINIFKKVTRIVVKLGLLEKIKYPRSAYELRKDIPYFKNNTNI